MILIQTKKIAYLDQQKQLRIVILINMCTVVMDLHFILKVCLHTQMAAFEIILLILV